MIAKYIPCMTCMVTGGVPQCTMYAPGSRAVNSKLTVSPVLIVRYAMFAGMRAEWKSMECGIGALLTTLMRTRSPSRTRITGPGTVPPNVHPSYFTPFAISTVSCVIGMTNSLIDGSVTGITRASYAGCVAVIVLPKSTRSIAESGRAAETKSQVAATAERATVDEMSVRDCMVASERFVFFSRSKLLWTRRSLGRRTADSL